MTTMLHGKYPILFYFCMPKSLHTSSTVEEDKNGKVNKDDKRRTSNDEKSSQLYFVSWGENV